MLIRVLYGGKGTPELNRLSTTYVSLIGNSHLLWWNSWESQSQSQSPIPIQLAQSQSRAPILNPNRIQSQSNPNAQSLSLSQSFDQLLEAMQLIVGQSVVHCWFIGLLVGLSGVV